MKKAFILILFFSLFLCLIYIFIEQDGKTQKDIKIKKEEIITKEQLEERAIDFLLKSHMSGKVECQQGEFCKFSNVVANNFSFDTLSVDNYEDMMDFLNLLTFELKENLKDLIATKELSRISSDPIFDALIKQYPDDFNKKADFTLKITNFKPNKKLEFDFAFLSWFVSEKTYDLIVKNAKKMDIFLNLNYSIENSKISLLQSNFLLKVNLAKESVITINKQNKTILINIENYKNIKPIFEEINPFLLSFFKTKNSSLKQSMMNFLKIINKTNASNLLIKSSDLLDINSYSISEF